MSNKPSDSQRKLPQQGRSKALVEAILEATVRILSKLGSQEVTTKKIADLAGVSIGSLYQYFPNKESVLAALMDVAMKNNAVEVQKKIEEIGGKTMKESTDILVDFALEQFLAERQKNREIFRHAPELGRIPSMLKLRQLVVHRLAEEMEKHHPGREPAEYRRVCFIAVNSMMGVIHTMLYDDTQNYSMEELSMELKSMLNAYVERRAGIF
jgi:AcrR family transcriptional regulator